MDRDADVELMKNALMALELGDEPHCTLVAAALRKRLYEQPEQPVALNIELLDFYAANAMQVLLRNDCTSWEEDAEESFEIAEAMLAARRHHLEKKK